MIYLLTGILASALHVITGPDHLAAVTPLAIENKSKAWHVGIFWGLGHVTGMLLIGLLFILFKEFIPIDTISTYSEQIVGFVLIFIGLWAYYKAFSNPKKHHVHPHVHDVPEPHIHIHAHQHDAEHGHVHQHDKPVKQNNITALLVGSLHGFAGISHLVLIIPTLAFPSTADSVIYLIGFALGTIMAMVTYAVILGYISKRVVMNHKHKMYQTLRIAGGSFAILIGIFWIFSNAY
ncbi:MAG: sulfite exporter TauE/SafE family protein [Bacteroidota bacterium]|nr:sulfite exporter TauE/SafE family protein [Bacteroidota bacterium]